MKLKTLKDMQHWRDVKKESLDISKHAKTKKELIERLQNLCIGTAQENVLFYGRGNISIVDANELRQEAIKWIKSHENEKGYYDENVFIDTWIKLFFNLTEEDLK